MSGTGWICRAVVGGLGVWAALVLVAGAHAAEAAEGSYERLVLQDRPVGYWRLGGSDAQQIANRAAQHGQPALAGRVQGGVRLQQPGPRPPHYPLFDTANAAAAFSSSGSFIRVADPGQDSPLKFHQGDSITLEAWVNPSGLAHDRQVYIVGKGRTNNPAVAADNQNYALRLRGMRGTAQISFLFRSEPNRPGNADHWHRWTSQTGFLPDGHWHHVAVTYTFGEPESLRGYLDGRPVQGEWDMGGPSSKPPVVDDDELWIGATLGGAAGNTFPGRISEVAVYRRALDAERITARYQAVLPDPKEEALAAAARIPEKQVLVDLHEGLPTQNSWDFTPAPPALTYTQSALAFVALPRKYSSRGLITDRSNPFLVRGQVKRTVAAGEYQLLLRAKGAARLLVDGRPVAQTNFLRRNGSGHEAVPELAQSQHADLAALAPGHQERLATITLDEGPHVFCLEVVVGGQGLRPEIGEVSVAWGDPGQPLALLTADPAETVPLSDEQWLATSRQMQRHVQQLEARHRRQAAAETDNYWSGRHELARRQVAGLPPLPVPEVAQDMPAHNAIDQFIGARLSQAGVRPAPQTDDHAFLRRLTLDTVGVIPSRQELAQFQADPPANRRRQAIDRLLDDPRWADHWVGYWQDVLAENPGILKPELNNTGPFRWWIYESFLDNKPMDQFVTELVQMEGSRYGGGPAGFALASQNDVPMAAKAHVLAQAFLGLEMKCARCHDAPHHPFAQEQLFNLAAMLQQKPLTLPPTSTVPPAGPGGREPLISITLNPGDRVAPDWPFAELVPEQLPEGVLRNADDPRERLAALLTSPHNQRFAQVIVNRLWHRYLGQGLVEPVDDWLEGEPSHPELLDYLARELVRHGYDLKHVARLILNSHTYQRQVLAAADQPSSAAQRLFASPVRRRMRAEQVVDSLFTAAGKSFDAELLTLDPEGRRPASSFLNLGQPQRAWQFTSLSNERDRPALALPVAQTIVDLLLAFGWRDARPNPITVRDQTPTFLQPLTLANGTVTHRAARLCDHSSLTELCLEEQPLEALIEAICVQILSRPPSDQEKELFAELLADGYADRRTAADRRPARSPMRNAVSWSNHLSAEATTIKMELEQRARQGDPPTLRLQTDWRERMEDVVWALLNSPEFVFVP